MSVNKFVSIRNPIVDAMAFLHIDHDKLKPLFTRFATIAEKEIGSAAQYELKRAVLDINQCVAKLPDDCVTVEIGILGNHIGDGCNNLLQSVCGYFNPASTYGTKQYTFYVIDADYGNSVNGNYGVVPYSIQNNKLIFQNSCNDQKHITIQYLAYKTDCDGFMEIGENHVNAIRWYIIWQYYMGKPSMNSLEYGKMNTAREEWNRECAHARAMDSILTPSERASIVGMMHDPYAGISLSQGMYTTLGGFFNNYN